MECKFTCFDRVMHLVKPMTDARALRTAVEVYQDESLCDFLDYCVSVGCFTQEQSQTLYEGIIMWEDLEGNYYEEDYDKKMALLEAVGVTEEVFDKYNPYK